MHRKVMIDIGDGTLVACRVGPDVAIHVGDNCLVESKGVPEFGEVLSMEEAPEDLPAGDGEPRLLRQATLQDQAKANENKLRSKFARETCEKKAAEMDLQMHLVKVRYCFDRSVLHIVFTADRSTDTHDLIRELARELHTRIDMRQVGVRDEAGMIGGVGSCGRALCCCSWLKHFESVNVKMAKTQRVSMNPTAMSGLCGRLKCCLRYENDAYRELTRGLPRTGARVRTPDGAGRVLSTAILKQTVKVELEDERIAEYPAAEVREMWGRRGKGRNSDGERKNSEWTEPRSARQERD